MAHHPEIGDLLARLELLSNKHENFEKEIKDLKTEIFRLKAQIGVDEKSDGRIEVPSPVTEVAPEFSATEDPSTAPELLPKKKSDLERFIGENLINKLGIIITVLGISIGAKYSIENEIIGPVTRIIIGYLAGAALLGFGVKLKKNYWNYSAVLVSGAIAILYFITYAAYNFYALFPQITAFGLMLVFTIFTVITALKYNQQVIALMGMVGAYAIPFLLSDGSGKVGVFFTYMAIINLGILAIAFKRYWKPLFYLAFLFTWLILLVWLWDSSTTPDVLMGLTFSTIFFIIFYLAFLGYKLLQKERYNSGDVILMLANSFIFYGIGFYLLNQSEILEKYLGLFSVANAGMHAVVSLVVNRQKHADRNLLYLIVGLALLFITITIPVQLDANWVTLLWAGEAALLFWIGRLKNTAVYEKISYGIMVLAFISLLQDWTDFYEVDFYTETTRSIVPFLNIGFLTSVLFISAFAIIIYLYQTTGSYKFPEPMERLNKLISYIIPGIFIFSIYYAFRLEIDVYWQQFYVNSVVEVVPTNQGQKILQYNDDLLSFKTLWIIIYSLLFLAILAAFNMKKLKNRELGIVILIFSIIAVLSFLVQGLILLRELWESHATQSMSHFPTGNFHIWIRYISIVFAGLLLAVSNKLVHTDFMKKSFIVAFDLFLHLSILTVASSELFQWMDLYFPGEAFKLNLSILWGLYALLLIILGIRTNQKHLRVAAMVLFGFILVKLFVYDISHLNTVSKTIVFVCLGVLLLVIPFLYNKYKTKISLERKT